VATIWKIQDYIRSGRELKPPEGYYPEANPELHVWPRSTVTINDSNLVEE
jgi:hypothetical protein